MNARFAVALASVCLTGALYAATSPEPAWAASPYCDVLYDGVCTSECADVGLPDCVPIVYYGCYVDAEPARGNSISGGC